MYTANGNKLDNNQKQYRTTLLPLLNSSMRSTAATINWRGGPPGPEETEYWLRLKMLDTSQSLQKIVDLGRSTNSLLQTSTSLNCTTATLPPLVVN